MSQTHNPKLYYECKYNKLNRLCVIKEIKQYKLNMKSRYEIKNKLIKC